MSKRVKQEDTQVSYAGYRVSEGESLDVVDLSKVTYAEFRDRYVFARKPCILRGTSMLGPDFSLKSFREELVETVGDVSVQAEKKVDGGFGSGKQRVEMLLSELLARFEAGDDSLYLTTQYGEPAAEDDENEEDEEEEGEEEEKEEERDQFFGPDDNVSDSEGSIDFDNLRDDYEDDGDEDEGGEDEEAIEVPGQDPMCLSEARARRFDLFQPPLTNLASKPNILPLVPPLFEGLVTQQVNLWMGLSKPSAEIPKPDPESPNLGVGRFVVRGTSSGLHHDHSDNLYVPIQGRKQFTIYGPYEYPRMYTVGNVRKLYDTGVIDYSKDSSAPEWLSTRADGCIRENETPFGEKGDLDPPSFSRIPPLLANLQDIEDKTTREELYKLAKLSFPGFLEARPLKAELEPGTCLYLPAGWFHEVTSIGVGSGVHKAINYWFAPPDGDSKAPYTAEDWSKDFERTKIAVGICDAE